MSEIKSTGQVLLKQNNSDNVIKYSIDDGSSWTDIDSWPVKLTNTDSANSTLKLQFESDLSFKSVNQYFIIGNHDITIDGSNNSVFINSVDNYLGLVNNGTSSIIGYSNINIKKLSMYGVYTIAEYGGPIGQRYFGNGATNNTVENCYSAATVSQYGGGFIGANSFVSATNCILAGNMTGDYTSEFSGGIFGAYSSGTATDCQCYNAIGNLAGGIFGAYSSGTATGCEILGDICVYSNTSDNAGGGGIFGTYSSGTATNCQSSGTIGSYSGGIFGMNSSGTATKCISKGNIGINGGGTFGAYSSGTSNNCFSYGTIKGQSGGIFGFKCSGLAINCLSFGSSNGDGDGAGGIFGIYGSGTAINCFSTGVIGTSAGGIFGQNSYGLALNCGSTGDMTGGLSGGIFGLGCKATAKNCWSTGNIGQYGSGGIFGANSKYCVAQNCYSTGEIGESSGGIYGQDTGDCGWEEYIEITLEVLAFASASLACYSVLMDAEVTEDVALTINNFSTELSSSGEYPTPSNDLTCKAINCYTTGVINKYATNYFGLNSFKATSTNCYYTNGGEWSDSDANKDLDISSDAWTDINLNATNVPYLLSSFTTTLLYDPSFNTNAASSGDGEFKKCSYVIVSINNSNPSDFPGITINTNTGKIKFDSSLSPKTYLVNVLATYGEIYYFGTFTNTITTLSASGSLLLQQSSSVSQKSILQKSKDVVSDIEYSIDNGITWLPIIWPVIINNNTPESTLLLQFNTNLTLNDIDQHFIMGTDNISVDGNNKLVNILVSNHPGLIQNGTSDTIGKSNVTISNIGVTSPYTVGEKGGWIGQAHFGNGALNNLVSQCFSTASISEGSGGILGHNSRSIVKNCFSSGDIYGGGGILGSNSSPLAYIFICYSHGDIYAGGGIVGLNGSSETIVNNCYSIGSHNNGAHGIGEFCKQINCHYTNGKDNWDHSLANAALNTSEGYWTIIDPDIPTIPHRLTSFFRRRELYSSSSGINTYTKIAILSGSYKWYITSINGSKPFENGYKSFSGISGISINESTGALTFDPTLPSNSYNVNVMAIDEFNFYSLGSFTNIVSDIVSNICFPAKTPIVTDQGIIPIYEIDASIHTIRNKKIVAITKTVSKDKYLVCFEKDTFGKNMPCQRTIMSKNHSLLYKGSLIEAKEFEITHSDKVFKIPYKGQILYNVLLEEHGKMVVNNLVCETLHPNNFVAQLYNILPKLNTRQQKVLITEFNKNVIQKQEAKISVKNVINEVIRSM